MVAHLKEIIVTGSQGFVGQHLIESLRKIRGVERIVEIDSKDGKTLGEDRFAKLIEEVRSPSMIVHLAATCSTIRGIDNPGEAFHNNESGTFDALEIARIYNIPILYTSSCKAKPVRGQYTPYGLSKYAGELWVKEYLKTYGIPYIINRPGTIYGPGQYGSPESGWLSWFMLSKSEGDSVTIYGDGTQVRDVLYVDDYVRLLVDQVRHFDQYKNTTYDVGGGEKNAISLLDAVNFLKLPYHLGPRRMGDAKKYVSDNYRVSLVRGWHPRMTWRRGILATMKGLPK